MDGQPLRFYKPSELESYEWKDVFVCLNVPFNSKQDAESVKVNELKSRIASNKKLTIT